jgi:carbamoyl-phosphate synthase large subunit
MTNYRITTPKTALILGSGGQKIGQAGEFDDAGLQAIRALKAENIRTILVNPNMTAAQTSEGVADATYFLPVTPEFVSGIIAKEKPDSILVNYGGKTAFACALALQEQGAFEKYNLQILGTSMDAIRETSDRKTFIALMNEAGVPVPKSETADGADAAKRAAEEIGYPVMLRAESRDESTGGVCATAEELAERCEAALGTAETVQVEEWLGGWKEVELEIVRDAMNNCIVACAMENVDPFGIHTGDSIIVAPCQTLTEAELQALRRTAIAVADRFNIIGNANMRFALDPESDDFRLIEVSARISRNTALASRATGYPLGFISARIALGFALSEIDTTGSPAGRSTAPNPHSIT